VTDAPNIVLTGGIGWGSMPLAASNGDGTFRVTNTGVADFPVYAQQAGAVPVTGGLQRGRQIRRRADGWCELGQHPGRILPGRWQLSRDEHQLAVIPVFGRSTARSNRSPATSTAMAGRISRSLVAFYLWLPSRFRTVTGSFHTKLTFLFDFAAYAAQTWRQTGRRRLQRRWTLGPRR
jgi:hypothetical protein